MNANVWVLIIIHRPPIRKKINILKIIARTNFECTVRVLKNVFTKKRGHNFFLKALDVENGFRTLLPLLPGDLEALVIGIERADDASSNPSSVFSL